MYRMRVTAMIVGGNLCSHVSTTMQALLRRTAPARQQQAYGRLQIISLRRKMSIFFFFQLSELVNCKYFEVIAAVISLLLAATEESPGSCTKRVRLPHDAASAAQYHNLRYLHRTKSSLSS